MQKRNCRFGTVRPILFSLSEEEHQSWDHLKVPFVFFICASDGQIFKYFNAKKGLVPQHSMSLLLLSITTRRGTGGCWTYLESQDGLGWKKHLEVIWSQTRPALMLDEVYQHVVQASFEYIQWQECHNITGQPLTAPISSARIVITQQKFTFLPFVALVLLLYTSEEHLDPSSFVEGICEISNSSLAQAFLFPGRNNTSPAGFHTANQYFLSCWLQYAVIFIVSLLTWDVFTIRMWDFMLLVNVLCLFFFCLFVFFVRVCVCFKLYNRWKIFESFESDKSRFHIF